MHLDKPDPNKPAFDIVPEALENTQYGRCPMCKKIVNMDNVFAKDDAMSSPFRDDLSRKEYSISGMCQDCQDIFFGV